MEPLPVQMVKIEESLQAVNHQNGRLKADLRDLQHERDVFKHDVTALRKQLQNLSDKVPCSGIPAFSLAPLEPLVNSTFDPHRTGFWRRPC